MNGRLEVAMRHDRVSTIHGEVGTLSRDAVYQTIFSRRDIRSQFTKQHIPDEVLARVLYAAHHAPSVGFSQPWDFILIREEDIKRRIHASFKKANEESTSLFDAEKQERYRQFKLEGITESPVNICVTYEKERFGPVVVGRTIDPLMGPFSCVCAVQNLWLAARAEGLGVGWVSIIHEDDVKEILGIPPSLMLIAYLCIGYVTHFPAKPELESVGWLPRVPLSSLVHCNTWGGRISEAWQTLYTSIQNHAGFPAEDGSDGK